MTSRQFCTAIGGRDGEYKRSAGRAGRASRGGQRSRAAVAMRLAATVAVLVLVALVGPGAADGECPGWCEG